MKTKKKRKGSWNILIVTIAITMTWAKWFAKRFAIWTGPFMMFISFLTTRYRKEIEYWINRIKASLFGIKATA